MADFARIAGVDGLMSEFPAFLIKRLTSILACEFGIDSHEQMYSAYSRYTGTGA